MKRLFFPLLTAVLAACAGVASPTPTPEDPRTEPPPLPDYGPAPELENDVWLNVDGPLRLADLRGRVVLLEMWTFG